MYNAKKPDASELPSTKQLLKSTGIAAVIATALLATVVLPAEYGVDPTGAGSLLGLTEMGRIKMALAAEAEAEAAAHSDAESSVPPAPLAAPPPGDGQPSASNKPAASAIPAPEPAQSAVTPDETVITLQPDEAREIKLVMKEGAKAKYLWFTDGPKVNYDTHGDGSGTNYYGYGKGSTERLEGVLTAAFTGNHGWFWRNRSGEPVSITLRTSGDYSDIKEIK